MEVDTLSHLIDAVFLGPRIRQGFPGSSRGKEFTCKAGDPGSIPRLGRSPGDGNGNPLGYSGLENLMDCIVHGVAKSRTKLSDFHLDLNKGVRQLPIPLKQF